jgi:alpha-1,3-mannosyltransferase
VLATVGGNLTRQPEQDRIDFLAQVRNAALEPLWLETGSEEVAGLAPWYNSRSRGLQSQVLWPADKVIFLNDVYFCARDAVRLLLHDADMACGMDFDRKTLDQVPVQVTPPPP